MKKIIRTIVSIIFINVICIPSSYQNVLAQNSKSKSDTIREYNDYFCNLAIDGTFKSFRLKTESYGLKIEEVLNELSCQVANSSKPDRTAPLFIALVSQKGNVGSFTKDVVLHLIKIDKLELLQLQLNIDATGSNRTSNLFSEIRYHYKYADGNDAIRRELKAVGVIFCRIIKRKALDSLADFHAQECPFQPEI